MNRILLGFILVSFIGCSTFDPLAGGSSQQGNGVVVGKVVNKYGTAAPNIVVKLYPMDYNPLRSAAIPGSCIDTTDSNGNYMLKAPRSSHVYQIYASNILKTVNALAPNITISGDTTHIADVVVSVPGTVKVAVPGNADSSNGYIYIPGTDIFVALNGNTEFALLTSVPEGVLSSIQYSVAGSIVSSVIRYDVSVIAADTVTVFNPAWKYARSIILNTTASGAAVAGNVYDFPVLIRLNSSNFDCTQAKNSGADIRFTKQGNAFLPYEIERWDAVNGQAEIWVRVDTVYGSDSTQFITMYWGNIDAPGQSNSVTVFDTASGFQAVWHLGENGDSVFDATGNAFNGENAGSAPAAGMIGNARNFANGNYIKISGLLNSPANITLSAWVQSTASNPGQEVVSLGDNVLLRLDESYGIGTCGEYHYSVTIDTSFAITKSGRNIANTGWHFIAYSIDMQKNVQALYIDGAQCATSNHADPIKYTGLGKDTYIGIHGNGQTYYDFIGRIDEVRVSNVPLNQDWIKLCFMNQKGQDALVKW